MYGDGGNWYVSRMPPEDAMPYGDAESEKAARMRKHMVIAGVSGAVGVALGVALTYFLGREAGSLAREVDAFYDDFDLE